ncbi:alpha/beta hydrolase [Streptomyces guryensis]|uniref:Alpha/beta hydrolase n=1 Tax=Streptomyces guryensis TaxID=2886947 RepID=A0A9Q3VW31_9ACTN|nr:alpha/beta hydrolase [Streptomyces guryensis]MCD9878453.1 alpha/beta hydrolase [Streptomyces guryensis]
MTDPSYPIDPELAPRLEFVALFDFTDHEAARAGMNRGLAYQPPYESPVPLTVQDELVPGPADAPPVAVRVHRPAGQGEVPGLLYLHGGGFVLGSIATSDADARRLAAETGAAVVLVDYRLAPEHPYPAAIEDCYAALEWVAKNAAGLGIDAHRIGVFGESAGGALAAALTLLTRDRGGPDLCFQCLLTPVLDDRLLTESMRAYTDTPGWSRPDAELSWDHFLGEGVRGGDGVSSFAAPARAEDLSGLPPAFVGAAQFDPLRDEAIAYAQRLAQAAVLTELHLYPGTFHGANQGSQATVATRMNTDVIAALRRGLHSPR